MLRFLKLLRLRWLQIELHGFEVAGNADAARRTAAEEARLRAQLNPI